MLAVLGLWSEQRGSGQESAELNFKLGEYFEAFSDESDRWSLTVAFGVTWMHSGSGAQLGLRCWLLHRDFEAI